MERDDQTIKGWRKYKYKFTLGAPTRNEPAEQESSTNSPCTCSKEAIGCGCYQAVVDVDELDQQ